MSDDFQLNDIDSEEIDLTVVFKNTSITQSVPSTLSFNSFQQIIYELSSVPITGQKIFAAKSGLVKIEKLPNGAETPVSTVFPTPASRKRILLMGTPEQELVDLQQAHELYEKKRQLKRQRNSTTSRPNTARSVAPQSKNVRTISSIQDQANAQSAQDDFEKPNTEYTFHKIVPLPFLPNPRKSLEVLNKLRHDRGILAIMKKYKWSVPILTELDPSSNTQHHYGSGTTRLLGLNRNQGQIIELRLRTDAYDGYVKFNDIRKVLCHELTHNVYGDHDDKFWNLCHKLEKEVVELDPFGKKGKTVSGNEDFYSGPRMRAYDGDDDQVDDNDMYDYDDHHRLICDDGGYTGGIYTLGSAGPSSSSSSKTQPPRNEQEEGKGESKKDSVKSILRQAALDREQRKQSEGLISKSKKDQAMSPYEKDENDANKGSKEHSDK